MSKYLKWECFVRNDAFNRVLYFYHDEYDMEYAIEIAKEFDDKISFRKSPNFDDVIVFEFPSDIVYNMFCMHIELKRGIKDD